MHLGMMAIAHVFRDITIDKFNLQAIKHHHTSLLRLFKLTFRPLSVLLMLGVIVMIGGNFEVVNRSVRDSRGTAYYYLCGILSVVLLQYIFMIPQSGADDRR